MVREWVVVLELVQPSGLLVLDRERISRALVALADTHPVVLMSDNRYAVQLRVAADGPACAVLVGLSRWRDESARLFIPAWELVRVEVLTPAELESELTHTTERLLTGDRSGDESEAILNIDFRDALTGVATRGMFTECVARALAHGPVVGRIHSVFVIDLEDVREVLLIAAADSLAEVVRDGDLVGRLGPDRFGVLLRNTTVGAAGRVAERIVERLRDSVPFTDGEIRLRPSVGVAVSSGGQNVDGLLEEAAAAAVIGRRRGGDCSTVFNVGELL